MGTYSSAFRTAPQLTGVARAAADVIEQSFVLSSWFPSVENFALTYEFEVNTLGLTDAATYRSFDTEAPYGSTPGRQSRAGKLPPISRKLRVNEYDQLTMMQQPDAIGAKFEEYATRLGAQVAARIALAQGQAVETGKISLEENNLSFEIDFGRKASHSVAAAVRWSDPSADALTDLIIYKAAYVATNKTAPAVAMMSTEILSALQQNESIIKAALDRTIDAPPMISVEQVYSVFTKYQFGRIVINDDKVNVNGLTTRVINSDKFNFLPEPGGPLAALGGGGGLGSTQWGVPAEAINPTYGIAAGEMPGIFATAFHEPDPEGHDVLVSAIALPTEENANATFTADVL